MAKSFDDGGEFLLPPQFLTDDDVLMDLETDFSKSLFLNRFGSFQRSSDLASPVGSPKTESDEEEFLAGLNRKMAGATLQKDWRPNDRLFGTENAKGLNLSGSPQSPLCPVGSGCGCRQWSSHGSPKCQSRLPSPPSSWDLLYAAAEIARLRANEEAVNHGNSLLAPPRKPSPNLDSGRFYPPQSLSHQKLQAAQLQFEVLKQQQMMKVKQRSAGASLWAVQKQELHVVQNRVENTDFVGIGANRTGPLGVSPTTWSNLQQFQSQNGSGMRAVYLSKPAPKRECAGTGVFLPRRVENNSPALPPRRTKKPGCSTVLLPAKVVQALNLNLGKIGDPPPPPPSNGSYTRDSVSAPVKRGNGNGYSGQRRNSSKQQQGTNHRELRLPQEWSY